MQAAWEQLADILVNYSVQVKPGDKVLIAMVEAETLPLARACYQSAIRAGGLPFVEYQSAWLERDLMRLGSREQVDWVNEMQLYGMDWADCYIGLRGARNPFEFADIPNDVLARHKKAMGVISARRNETRWVLSKVPNEALAQQASLPLDSMMDFYFRSTLMDWQAQRKMLDKVAGLLSSGSQVRIVGKETDLIFSTEGRVYEVADGRLNMPDGEVFTSPVEDSVNGHIYFEFPGTYAGRNVYGIRLKFQDGQLTEACAESGGDLLVDLLKMDEGASRMGEFGIGLNYGIDRYVGEVLYDEKIGGTIHIAMGRGYPECGGKNQSALHWDLVKDTRQDAVVYLDGRIVMENGAWEV